MGYLKTKTEFLSLCYLSPCITRKKQLRNRPNLVLNATFNALGTRLHVYVRNYVQSTEKCTNYVGFIVKSIITTYFSKKDTCYIFIYSRDVQHLQCLLLVKINVVFCNMCDGKRAFTNIKKCRDLSNLFCVINGPTKCLIYVMAK